jgi:hypothetical protein
MTRFSKRYNELLEKTNLDANELKEGDKCLNINPDCTHFKSKGKVLKVYDIEQPGKDNTVGKFIRYKVLNNGPTYEKGDILDKTEIQLKKIK